MGKNNRRNKGRSVYLRMIKTSDEGFLAVGYSKSNGDDIGS